LQKRVRRLSVKDLAFGRHFASRASRARAASVDHVGT
jgi:hypothetical protein